MSYKGEETRDYTKVSQYEVNTWVLETAKYPDAWQYLAISENPFIARTAKACLLCPELAKLLPSMRP